MITYELLLADGVQELRDDRSSVGTGHEHSKGDGAWALVI